MGNVMILILRLKVDYFFSHMCGREFPCPAPRRLWTAACLQASIAATLYFTEHCNNLSLLIISIQSSCGSDGHEFFFPPLDPHPCPPVCLLPAWHVSVIVCLFCYSLRDFLLSSASTFLFMHGSNCLLAGSFCLVFFASWIDRHMFSVDYDTMF